MRSYELMMVVRPDLEEEATKAVVERAKGIITTGGGVVEKEDLWGKRRLAYEIRNFRDGYYAVLNFRAGTEVPKELDRVLRITDEVIRHIIVHPEE